MASRYHAHPWPDHREQGSATPPTHTHSSCDPDCGLDITAMMYRPNFSCSLAPHLGPLYYPGALWWWWWWWWWLEYIVGCQATHSIAHVSCWLVLGYTRVISCLAMHVLSQSILPCFFFPPVLSSLYLTYSLDTGEEAGRKCRWEILTVSFVFFFISFVFSYPFIFLCCFAFPLSLPFFGSPTTPPLYLCLSLSFSKKSDFVLGFSCVCFHRRCAAASHLMVFCLHQILADA